MQALGMELFLGALFLIPETLARPEWSHAKCWWNEPSEECLTFIGFSPVSSLTPKNKCAKTTIDSEAKCLAQNDTVGNVCFWRADSSTCLERSCTNFDQATCEQNNRSGFHCLWDGWQCTDTNTKCMNTDGYSSEAACTADAAGVGPCTWKDSYSPKCQQVFCSDFKNQTNCFAATSVVPAMTFLIGSAPYGKTPCHWDGDRMSCRQIYHCADYRSQKQCTADSAGFGRCLWNSVSTRCVDMMSCSDYTSKSSCLADSYKSAARKHPHAQCWWQEGPAAITVGNSIKLSGIFESKGPLRTSSNLEIDEDRILKFLDGKGSYLGLALGLSLGSLSSRPVAKVTNGASVVQAWEDVPKPIPEGYTIQLEGACDDNLPRIADYFGGPDCEQLLDQASCSPVLPATPTPVPAATSESNRQLDLSLGRMPIGKVVALILMLRLC